MSPGAASRGLRWVFRRRGSASGPCSPRRAGTIISRAGTTRPTTPRNTQCQLSICATMPAAKGPTSEGITQAAENAAKIFGCSTGG